MRFEPVVYPERLAPYSIPLRYGMCHVTSRISDIAATHSAR